MTEIDPTTTLRAFDEFLAREGLSFSAVVIGGAALHVLGHISRTTDDVDVLVPQVPQAIADAAGRFAALGDSQPTDKARAALAEIAEALEHGDDNGRA